MEFFARHRKTWLGLIVIFSICMFIAQPLSEETGISLLAPVSEVFTFPVSATFIGGSSGLFNLTVKSPASNRTISELVVENFGQGSITLSGKGALSVDNELTETVRWLMPASLDVNMTNATMSFHTDFAMFSPTQYNSLGFPENALFSLYRTGHTYVAPNGTKLWTEWQGSRTVSFVESGPLPSELYIDNLSLTYPSFNGKGHTQNLTDITGFVPAYIEVGTEEATSSVRNNDWVITLTFAILVVGVVDLGSRDNANYGEANQNTEDNQNETIDKYTNRTETSSVSQNTNGNREHEQEPDDHRLLNGKEKVPERTD